ncbi:MAG TPA: helix-turn-helix transcriptional regulator [Symbiobacteriaceae bacterium]|nr:helix-turn-helix transcriptional regulator [Symbiobacteriaceae bacterium]
MAQRKSLADLRKAKGLTQEDVAKVLGKSAAAYCRKENGVRPLFALELQKLADLFGVPLDEIDFFAQDLTDTVSVESKASNS